MRTGITGRGYDGGTLTTTGAGGTARLTSGDSFVTILLPAEEEDSGTLSVAGLANF